MEIIINKNYTLSTKESLTAWEAAPHRELSLIKSGAASVVIRAVIINGSMCVLSALDIEPWDVVVDEFHDTTWEEILKIQEAVWASEN